MLLETQGETKAPSDPNTDTPTRALMNRWQLKLNHNKLISSKFLKITGPMHPPPRRFHENRTSTPNNAAAEAAEADA